MKKTLIISLVISLLVCGSAFAATPITLDQQPIGPGQDIGPGSSVDIDYVLGSVDDCEYCKMIDELYANEPNIVVREVATAVMKSCIHPDAGVYVPNNANAMTVANVPWSDSLRYRLVNFGMTAGFPMYSIGSTEAGKSYIFNKTDYSQIDRNKADLLAVYNYVMGARDATVGMDSVNKLNYYVDLICKDFNYDYSFVNFKLSDIIESHMATCVGYSDLLYLLCMNGGLRCNIVGNSNHAYNEIMTDEGSRYVDVTWIECGWPKESWFLASYDDIADADHVLPDYFSPAVAY